MCLSPASAASDGNCDWLLHGNELLCKYFWEMRSVLHYAFSIQHKNKRIYSFRIFMTNTEAFCIDGSAGWKCVAYREYNIKREKE